MWNKLNPFWFSSCWAPTAPDSWWHQGFTRLLSSWIWVEHDLIIYYFSFAHTFFFFFSCFQICNKKFSRIYSIKQHLLSRKHHVVGILIVSCQLCVLNVQYSCFLPPDTWIMWFELQHRFIIMLLYYLLGGKAAVKWFPGAFCVWTRLNLSLPEEVTEGHKI